MKNRGVSGVAAPDSQYVANPDLVTVRSMSLVLQRLQGSSTTTAARPAASTAPTSSR
jgi:hypothetical protein